MWRRVKGYVSQNRNKLLAGVSFILGGYFIYKCSMSSEQVILSDFMKMLNHKQISEVIFNDKIIFFRAGQSDWFSTFLGDMNPGMIVGKITQAMGDNIIFSFKKEIISNEAVSIVASCGISCLLFKYMMKQMTTNNVSTIDMKSRIYGGEGFQSFYGGADIKIKLREIIDFMENPKKYQEMGARIRRGVVLHGPPGTGKTMLARALAHESGCSFIKMVASEFQELFVGIGAKRVRELFANARKCANGCIIFIDEIDALGSRLNYLRDSHETTTTINQFLSEMDGFSPLDRVVVIAATNRLDLVDSAILRAGRFDLKIRINPPGPKERRGIFLRILQNKLGNNFSLTHETLDNIERDSQQWCGADFQTLVNESIFKAILENEQKVNSRHITAAFYELIARK